MLALILVSISVGMDNLGAATAIGVSGVDGRLRLRVGLIFGIFEAAMPLVGLLLGRSVAHSLGGNTNIVAGVILGLVGVFTIASELLGERPRTEQPRPPSLVRLVGLGATLSSDNLAIGFALGTYHVSVALAASVIAVFSVTLSLVGLEIGARLGERFGQRSELVGGVLLVGIGVPVGTGAL